MMKRNALVILLMIIGRGNDVLGQVVELNYDNPGNTTIERIGQCKHSLEFNSQDEVQADFFEVVKEIKSRSGWITLGKKAICAVREGRSVIRVDSDGNVMHQKSYSFNHNCGNANNDYDYCSSRDAFLKTEIQTGLVGNFIFCQYKNIQGDIVNVIFVKNPDYVDCAYFNEFEMLDRLVKLSKKNKNN